MKNINAMSGRTLEDSENGDGDTLLYTNTYPYDDLSDDRRRSSLLPGKTHQVTTQGKCLSFTIIALNVLLFGGSCFGLASAIKLDRSTQNQSWTCDLVNMASIGVLAASCVFLILSIISTILLFKGPLRNCCPTSSGCNKGTLCSIFTIIFTMILTAVVLVGGLLTASFYRLSTQVGSTTAPRTFPGSNGTTTTLIHDENGLPRIHAATKIDAFFAQGYAQAEDRLWELEFTRLVVQGRLAEMLGKPALKTDKQTRTLGFRRAAEEMCEGASDSSKALFQSYVDGINHYLKTRTERPVEFGFMGQPPMKIVPQMRLFSFYEPEPFDLNLVCFASKLIQWEMAGDAQTEAMRFKIWWMNPDTSFDDISQIFNNYTNVSHTILNSEQLSISEKDVKDAYLREYNTRRAESENYQNIFDKYRQQAIKNNNNNKNDNKRKAEQQQHQQQQEQRTVIDESSSSSEFPDIFAFRSRFASNGWVARDSVGRPAGASDPHLQITLPSVWYQVHMQWGGTPSNPNFHATGVSLCGMPGIGIGKRNDLFWAITAGQTDTEDLFVLNQTSVSSPNKYAVKKDPNSNEFIELDLTTRTEVIKVLGEDDVVLNIQESIYGSDVTDVFFEADTSSSDGFVWCNTASCKDPSKSPFRFHMYSPVFRPDNTSADAFANTLDESISAADEMRDKVCALLASPAFSISIADESGGLSYSLTGHHQERNSDHWGRWPHFATQNEKYFYKQFIIPFTEKPGLYITGGGTYVASFATANQKIYPDGYKYDLGASFSGGYRSRRLQTLLAEADPSTLGDLSTHRRIQTDHISGFWLFALQPAVKAHSKIFLFDYTSVAKNLPDFQKQAWFKAQTWIHTAGLGTAKFDGNTDVGTTAISFMWKWVQEFSSIVAPLTMNKVTDSQYWHALLFIEKSINTSLVAPYAEQVLCKNYLVKHSWYGNNHFPTLSNADDKLCIQALVVAMLRTAVRYPTDENLKWAIDVKPFHANNRMMSSTPLKCMFDRTLEKDGDTTTIDVSDFNIMHESLPSTAASSMRSVYSAKSGQNHKMLFIMPGGASGNPYDKRYENLLEMWRSEQYLNLTTNQLF